MFSFALKLKILKYVLLGGRVILFVFSYTMSYLFLLSALVLGKQYTADD